MATLSFTEDELCHVSQVERWKVLAAMVHLPDSKGF